MDQTPVEIGGEHLGLIDGLWIDGEDVAIEHDEIGALTGFEAPGRLVLLHGVGGVDGVGVDRRLKRDALIDIERLLPVASGARDTGLKRPERIIR